MATVRTFVIYVCFLTAVVQAKAGLTCFSFTPFTVNIEKSGVESTVRSLTTKTCKDNEHCSKLEITDTLNKTYNALDCLDQGICSDPNSWCQKFTSGSSILFSTCRIQCCKSNLCANLTNVPPPPSTPSSHGTIPKATCSIFAHFKVNFKTKQVTKEEGKVIEKVCETHESCGGVILVDAANKTHYGSDCVSKKFCKNPNSFCKTVTEGSNGTFRHCSLKCCNRSLCLDEKKVAIFGPKCYRYTPFIIEGRTVKMVDGTKMGQEKQCNKDELCSLGTFQDHKNNTHISQDCLPKSVCDNPRTICQHFSDSNPESAFIKCKIECCKGDLCFSIPSTIEENMSNTTSSQVSSTQRPQTFPTSSQVSSTQRPQTFPTSSQVSSTQRPQTFPTTNGVKPITASTMLIQAVISITLCLISFLKY